jgi:hypothetical protein
MCHGFITPCTGQRGSVTCKGQERGIRACAAMQVRPPSDNLRGKPVAVLVEEKE